MHLFRDRGWALRVPRSLQEMSRRMAALSERMSHRLGRPPTAEELAEASGEDVERVTEALWAQRAYTVEPLTEGPVSEDGERTGARRSRAERRGAGLRRRAAPRHARAGDPAAPAARARNRRPSGSSTISPSPRSPPGWGSARCTSLACCERRSSSSATSCGRPSTPPDAESARRSESRRSSATARTRAGDRVRARGLRRELRGRAR